MQTRNKCMPLYTHMQKPFLSRKIGHFLYKGKISLKEFHTIYMIVSLINKSHQMMDEDGNKKMNT